jgi:hypothetical protein
MCVYARIVLSRLVTALPLEMYLSYFSHPLMVTLIFHEVISNILLLYRLPYFVSSYVLVLSNFAIGLWVVSLHVHKQELNYHYHYYYYYYY